MTSSVTRTISVAMIVLELNGHLSHAVPLMVCALCSYATSEYLRPLSFFEMLSELGGLDAKISAKGKIIIKDILDHCPSYKEMEYLSLNDSTEQDLINMVKKHTNKENPNRLRYIPVVDQHSTMNLMYQIKVDELREYCELYFGFSDENNPGIGLRIGQPDANDWNNVSQMPQPKDLRAHLIDQHISNDVANSVFRIASRKPTNPARDILNAMRHIPPLVIYQDAPISYMAEGLANKFYEGEGENTNDQCDDPSVIIYYIVRALEYDEDQPEDKGFNINASEHSPVYHAEAVHKFGCRLVGMIPCSDAFGVDLIID